MAIYYKYRTIELLYWTNKVIYKGSLPMFSVRSSVLVGPLRTRELRRGSTFSLSISHSRMLWPSCRRPWMYNHLTQFGCLDTRYKYWFQVGTYTVKPVLAVTSIKQPTCLKQPNKMFPNVKFVLIFISVKQPPALSSHYLCFPCVAVKHRFDCITM